VSNRRRLLLSPLWLLIALAAMLGPNATSAAASSATETRVRAFEHVTVDSVGQQSSERPASVGCVRPETAAIVSGSCVATETASSGARFVAGSDGVITDLVGEATDAASVAETEQLALPRGSPTLTQGGLDHIVERHWATSDAEGAGKFAAGTTGRSLKSMIEETVASGGIRPNTLNRTGWIYEYDFGSKIGIDIGGNETPWLRVVLNPDNTVRTAFPVSP
jgi:hypothetical protein